MVTTTLSGVLQFLSNSSSKLEVIGVWADLQLIIKFFFNDFSKSCNNRFEAFFKYFQKKKIKSDFSGFHFETNRMVLRNLLKSEKDSYPILVTQKNL